MLRETKPRPSPAGQSARQPWLGEGRRKSGKREEVNEEERGGRKVKVVNREGKVKMRRGVEGVEWGGERN